MKAQDALAEGFPGYTSWANSSKWTVANGKTIVETEYGNFVQYQCPSGRLYHVKVHDRVSKAGRPYKSVKTGEVTSSCLISIEAYAMKKALTETYYYKLAHRDQPYQINSFTHDDVSVSDFTSEQKFLQYTYNRIAYWFTQTLGDLVPSTMAEDDGKWKKSRVATYADK